MTGQWIYILFLLSEEGYLGLPSDTNRETSEIKLRLLGGKACSTPYADRIWGMWGSDYNPKPDSIYLRGTIRLQV